MRAREFTKEARPGLADVLKAAITSAQPKQTTANPNQMGTTQGAQGSIGPQSASQASAQQQPSGGTSTQPQQPGAVGSFIKGMTGGKTDSLSGLAGLGAAKTMQKVGMGSTANAVGKAISQPELPADVDPKAASATLKPGTELDVPQLGKIKVNKVTPQGIELDTSRAPSIGVRNMTVDLKSLAKK